MESELFKINDEREAMEKEMGGIVELLENM